MKRGGRGGRGGGPRMGGGRIGGRRSGGRRIGAGGRRPGRSGRGGFGGGRNRGYGRPRGGYRRRRPRPFFPMWGWGGFGRRRRYGGPGCGGCLGGMGCLPIIFVLIIAVFVMNFAWTLVPGSGGNTIRQTTQVNESSRDREPIEEGLVDETPYYTDDLNWIQDETTLVNGMRHFYNETNIQPHLYITDNLEGDENPSIDEIDQATIDLYDDLFTDEAHLLLVFFENESYEYGVTYHTAYGSQTQIVVDQEAEDILFDYLDYYYTSDLTDEEYFGIVFQETADRIMEETTSPWIPVLIVIGLIILVWLLYRWWRNSIKENKESEETEYSNGRRVVKEEADNDNLDDF